MSDNGWRDQASCKDSPGGFFPTTGELIDPAIYDRCERCPVVMRCLNYALDNKIKHGIWGGKSNRQREKLRKLRASQ